MEHYYKVINSNFGVLWSDEVDSGTSNWFKVGISEVLLKELVSNWYALVLMRKFRGEWTYVVHNGTICMS